MNHVCLQELDMNPAKFVQVTHAPINKSKTQTPKIMT